MHDTNLISAKIVSVMTDTEKAQIKVAIENGRFIISAHASMRMYERSISHDDIRRVGQTAHTLDEQDGGKLRLVGFDVEGSQTSVIAVNDDGVIIVTVY